MSLMSSITHSKYMFQHHTSTPSPLYHSPFYLFCLLTINCFPKPFLKHPLSFPDYLSKILQWQREFNRQIFRVWIAGQHYSVLSKPEDIEVILSSTEVLLKRDVYDFLRPWLGDGLLTSYSTKWHKHRKIITPSFHFQILKEFLDTMNKTSNKFVEKLKKTTDSEQPIDIQELVHKCTLDIICGW